MWSYSRVNTFDICPLKFKFTYIDKMEKDRDKTADHAGLLGQTLGKMIELGEKKGGDWYDDQLYVISELSQTWKQILYVAAEKLEGYIDHGAEFEKKVQYQDVVGYIDCIDNFDMFDFKLTSAPEFYENSPQLAIYRYMLKKQYGREVENAYYLCVQKPKMNYKLNSWEEKRRDMLNQIKNSEIVEFVSDMDPTETWNEMMEKINIINNMNSFPKKKTGMCRSCEYKELCGETDVI